MSFRCHWCGKTYKTERPRSGWEQKSTRVGWQEMCNRCATRRLNNPWSGLLNMRKVGSDTGGESWDKIARDLNNIDAIDGDTGGES